jgi:hypothetical protein
MAKAPKPTPSMDDKTIPSPPVRTNDQYTADKAAGVERVGFDVQDARKTPG